MEATHGFELPFGHVPRTRLTDLLTRPYQASVTLITAEAGAGKTTLAVEWARQAAMPVAWVAFGGSLTDAMSLVDAMDVAVRDAIGDKDTTHPPRPLRSDSRHASIPDALSTLDRDLTLVIDSCEAIPDPSCLAVLDDLLALNLARLRLVLIGRRPLPLRLGRLRALGRVREIGSDALLFTPDEAEATLRALAPDASSSLESRHIWVRAEGWVAGIVLLGLAARRTPEAAVEGRGIPDQGHTFLDEYVQQEILAPMPAEPRGFVLATSELESLTPELCDVMLGVEGEAEILPGLHEEFPFIRRDARHHDRYRYHRLVRESLVRIARADVPAQVRLERSRRAAAWLTESGELAAAATIALGAVDTSWALAAIEPWCRHLADRSDFEELERWIARLPEPLFQRSADLDYWRIIAQLGQRRTSGIENLVDTLAARPPPTDEALHSGRLSLIQGLVAIEGGRDAQAETHLTRARRRLGDDALVERMIAASSAGRLAFRQGYDDVAAAAYKEAERHAGRLPLDERWSWFVIAPARANAYALRGDLFSAITKYRLIISEIPAYLETAGIEPFIRCRLVSILIERHDLQTAAQELQRIEAMLNGEPRAWHRDAIVARARLLLATGERDEAERFAADNLRTLRRLPEKAQLVHLLARIWLERGEYPLVESWLADIDASEYPWVQVLGDINFRMLAIGLDLARGRFEQAATATERMLAEANSARRVAEAIPLSARWAIALHHLGEEARAREVMREALTRGASGGFVRGFYVPGFDTLAMFPAVLAERQEFQPIRRGLQEILGHAGGSEPSAISKRELEVLRLVAAGRTNSEIAETMFISTNTVRNHLVRIGQRLHARNRQEAVARARELGILD